MTLQDPSNIAQIVSTVAVFISLVYVAYELRHNSTELRISTQQAQADAATGYLIHLGTDPAFLEMIAHFTPPNVPTDADRLRATLILNGIFAQFQAGWEAARTVRSGLTGWWSYQEKAMGGWLASPIVREWWARDRTNFSADFQKLVDAKIAATPVAAGPIPAASARAAAAAAAAPPLRP